MTDLLDWQIDLNGVLMGAGTPINIIETSGLGMPAVRASDVEQPGRDGLWPAPDYYGGRQVQIDAAVKVPGDPAGCQAVLAQLLQAADDPAVRLVGGATMPLRMKRPGRPTKVLYGRARRGDPEYKQLVFGYVPIDIEFLATDATWYGDSDQVTEIPLGWLSGGGFTAPVQAPIHVSSGATAADRPGWVNNGGDGATWPVLRVTGPCSNVTITNATTGKSLALPTLTLASSEWVELDTHPGQVSVLRENGGNAETLLSAASRLDLFSLPAGRSELRWTASDPTNTARLHVTWRNAYTAL
ncbi:MULTISPECIES: hypothetical protein [unclassified Streptomyces]|uniref:phage distal tail protein n=1 Tax=unclassified Streptomyces TaxID=2593676 RepID=UPI0033C985D4